ncbi:hypothetical protein CBR_g58027 [Chara braunii]|uniref:Uncharacterized protein n=1 Tax=Chara braunii TaxID=69332 RepID=A0A388MER8_CHABU|nr:hypothetical protein CBR_g58027 [Chara braunii]|eukprot:GBG92979.1 hypothetical protein CBR_g58027 [Chara braunii]
MLPHSAKVTALRVFRVSSPVSTKGLQAQSAARQAGRLPMPFRSFTKSCFRVQGCILLRLQGLFRRVVSAMLLSTVAKGTEYRGEEY